ncbi:MAG: hypothetical protein Q7R82_02660 [Candidatus Daviesbacteria bacterium]|nr:hypothetical protein [Candidatus Daviesbacteria bacterium]
MAIEDLADRYPSGAGLKDSIEATLEGRRVNNTPGNRLVALGDRYVDEGRNGLLSITEYLTEATGGLPELNNATLKLLDNDQRASMFRNKDAVIIGAAVQVIHIALGEQVSHAEILIGRYNLAIAGTLLRPPIIEGLELVQGLTSEQWFVLIDTWKTDKTFGSFFEPDGFRTLPKNLRAIFEETIFSNARRRSETEAFIKQHRLFALPLLDEVI